MRFGERLWPFERPLGPGCRGRGPCGDRTPCCLLVGTEEVLGIEPKPPIEEQDTRRRGATGIDGAVAAPSPVSNRLRGVDARALQRSVGNRVTGSLLRSGGHRTTAGTVQREPANASMPGPNSTPVMPKAATDRVIFEGQILSPDAAITKDSLEKVANEKGMVGLDGFVHRFASPGLPTSVANMGPTVDPKLRESIVATMNAQHNGLKAEEFAYRDTFEKQATSITLELLKNSEQKINEEKARYGIKTEKVGMGEMTTGVSNQPELVKMQGAAKLLAAEKRATKVKFDTWSTAQQKVLVVSGPLDIRQFVDPALTAAETSTRKEYTAAEEKYRKLRDDQTKLYPALAMFAGGDESAASLDMIAAAPPSLLGQHMGALMIAKLANIQKVRSEIGGRFSIWKQPTIMQIAGKQTSIKPWLGKAMEDHAKLVRADEASSKLMWTAIAVGLGLLAAIPTGGSSAIAAIATVAAVGGAGVSAYQTYEEVQKASLQGALTGTDMDKAKALSKDDPGWFWLAVDVIGAVGDVFGAVAAFKALKGAITVARAAKTPQLAPLVQELKRAGLSVEAQARVIKETLTAEKIALTIEDVMAVFTNASKTAHDPKLAKALETAAADFIKQDKVLVLKNAVGTPAADAEIVAFVGKHAVGRRQAAEAVAAFKKAMPGAEGGYMASLDIIVSRGESSAENIAMILSHELTHGHQSTYAAVLEMSQYEKEFQAHLVQGQFLRMLPPGSVPTQWQWLATASAAEIETRVLTMYPKSFKPHGFDNNESAKFILETLRGKAGG